MRILHFLSYSFGIETTNTLIHNRISFVNYTQFQTKMSKIYIPFGAAHTWLTQGRTPPPSRANHSVPWTAYLFKPEMRLIVCLDLAGQVVTGNDSSHAFFKTLTSRMKKIIMSSTVLIWRVNVNTFCVEYYPHFLPDNFADEYKRKVIKGYLFCGYSFI